MRAKLAGVAWSAGRRLLVALIGLSIAVIAAFLLIRANGSAARSVAGADATASEVAAVRHRLGLDRPLIVQLGSYLGQLAKGDLGSSYRYSIPNIDLIGPHLLRSLELEAVALALAVLIGCGLGIAAALAAGSVIDRLVSMLALLTQAAPPFWLGLMLITIVAVRLGWLPSGGSEQGAASLILPAVTMASFPSGQIARITRSSYRETLRQDFLTATRVRGLSSLRLYGLHALRNASLSIVTVVGLQAGALMSAAVTIEYVFGWPGLGLLTVHAVQFRDLPLVQSLVVLGAATFVAINLLLDVVYALLDPRIRRGKTA